MSTKIYISGKGPPFPEERKKLLMVGWFHTAVAYMKELEV